MLNDTSVASAGSYIRTCRRIRNSKKIATIRDFHQNICVNSTNRICRNVNQLCLHLLSFILVWDTGLLHVHTKAAFWHSWLPSLAGPCFTNCRQLNSIQLRRNVAKARRSSGSAHAPPPGCNYETASSAESRAPKRQTIGLAKFIFSFPSHIFFQTSEATISLFMWLSLLQYVTEHWCILQKLWNNKLGFICFILSSNILPEFLSFFAKNLHFKKKNLKKILIVNWNAGMKIKCGPVMGN